MWKNSKVPGTLSLDRTPAWAPLYTIGQGASLAPLPPPHYDVGSTAGREQLQETLEEDDKKDTSSFAKEDLEEIHRSGTAGGLLGIYNFPGSV